MWSRSSHIYSESLQLIPPDQNRSAYPPHFTLITYIRIQNQDILTQDGDLISVPWVPQVKV